MRAGFPADQQSEGRGETHVRAWPLVEVRTVFIVRCLRVMKIHFVCLFGAMDAFGAKRSIVDEGMR
jgi:hypothetical protein